jgi:ribosomal protein L13
LGEKVGNYLTGKWKPIWHPETDCGDNVVVVNCKDVALKAFDWKQLEFHFNKVCYFEQFHL